jgi:hypothetical protein
MTAPYRRPARRRKTKAPLSEGDKRLTQVVTSVTMWRHERHRYHATYTITRRGHAVGILAPPDHLPVARADAGDAAWDHLEELMNRMGQSRRSRKSVVRELAAMRR